MALFGGAPGLQPPDPNGMNGLKKKKNSDNDV
jgi:hypothetical protein